MLVGLVAEPGGGGAQPVADGLRDVRGVVLEDARAVAELGGLLVGAGDVAAAGDAVVEAGGVLDPVAVAEGPVSLVVAEQEGVRVVVDHGVLVRQQLAGAGEGDRGAGEAGRRGGGLDGAAGCGPGDAAAVFEVVVQAGDGVGDRAGGLEVDEVVDAVAAAGGVSLGVQSKAVRMCPYWMARATSPLGRRAMCQARVRRKRARPMFPCGSAGMTSPGRPWLAASWFAQVTKSSIRSRSALIFREPVSRPFAVQVVGVVVEQQVPVRDHALQDADGVDDRGDGHPGDLALGAAGTVVAVFVGGGLELVAADQVPSGPARRDRDRDRGSIRCAGPGPLRGACRSGRRRR